MAGRQLTQNVDAENHVNKGSEPKPAIARQLLGGACFVAVATPKVFVDGGQRRQGHRLLLGKQRKNVRAPIA